MTALTDVLRRIELLALFLMIYPQSVLAISRSEFIQYFNETEPGSYPAQFAPGILPPKGVVLHSSPVISSDWEEMYFSAFFEDEPRLDVILCIRLTDGEWSEPEIAEFSGEHDDDWPWFSTDEERIYFSSRRPIATGDSLSDEFALWYVDRLDEEWAEPIRITSTEDLDKDEGTLFLAAQLPGGLGSLDIYRLDNTEGSYSMPVNLGPSINSTHEEYAPCVSPDGSLLLFNRFVEEDSCALILYACCKVEENIWSDPIDMSTVDSGYVGGRFPCFSPDGEILFFIAEGGKEVRFVLASSVFRQCM